MCNGPTHAVAGLAAGLGAAAIYGTAAEPMPTPVVAICGLLGAGGALLNDFDSHSSTASHAGGFATTLVHKAVRGTSLVVFNATATEEDRKRTKGTHRGLTHTLPSLPVQFAAVWGVTAWFGKPATLAVLFCTLYLALRGLPPVNREFTDAVMAAAGTGFAWVALPPSTSAVLIAASVAVGSLSHTLVDSLTDKGCPLWGPFTWRRVWLLPESLRLSTGHSAETFLLFPVFVVAAVLLFPGVWPLAMDTLANIHR